MYNDHIIPNLTICGSLCVVAFASVKFLKNFPMAQFENEGFCCALQKSSTDKSCCFLSSKDEDLREKWMIEFSFVGTGGTYFFLFFSSQIFTPSTKMMALRWLPVGTVPSRISWINGGPFAEITICFCLSDGSTRKRSGKPSEQVGATPPESVTM